MAHENPCQCGRRGPCQLSELLLSQLGGYTRSGSKQIIELFRKNKSIVLKQGRKVKNKNKVVRIKNHGPKTM
jgi:hypothetical protein